MTNETIKRISPAFTDQRGAITNILEEPISHVAIITSMKGAVRGNHYHPEQTQYVYLISGKYESISKDLKKKDAREERVTVQAGDLVTTPPMIAHAMIFLEDSTFLNLTPGNRDTDKFKEHTIKFELANR
ncbi:cupin domain-containing protein [Candidatus Woesearchaeota archaeon]|nr:cupin domain-containing protein [Candidatus Woesearchaeota archaeon]